MVSGNGLSSAQWHDGQAWNDAAKAWRHVPMVWDPIGMEYVPQEVGAGGGGGGDASAANQVTNHGKLDALLTELQAKADLAEEQPVSLAAAPLPADAATQTTLGQLLTELQGKADVLETQPVSLATAPLPADAATQTTLGQLLTELQAKADLGEIQPVSLATTPLPSDAATSTNQGLVIAELVLLVAEQLAQGTTLDSLLTELQLKADLAEEQPVSLAALPAVTMAGTSAADTTATSTSPSSTALALNANRKFAKFTNHGNTFVYLSHSGTATATSPIVLVPKVGSHEIVPRDGHIYTGVVSCFSSSGSNTVGVLEES